MTVNSEFSRKKILIVEDDSQLADVMKNYIVGLGYDVDVLHNSYKVIDSVKSNNYVIIFLDVLIPGQTGLALLKEIKESERGTELAVVILTNVKDVKMKKIAMDYGVSEYLIKIDTNLGKIKSVIDRFDPK